MSIEKVRTAFALVIAVLVPLFFLMVYFSSCWSRLTSLRARCAIELEALLDALRRQRALASKWIERPQAHNNNTAHEIQKALERLDSLLTDAPEQIPALGTASRDLETAMNRLGPPAAPKPSGGGGPVRQAQGGLPGGQPNADGLQQESAESRKALLEAAHAYNRAVQAYAAARRQYVARPLVWVWKFPCLPTFGGGQGIRSMK
jgi:hypothetical protein